jgi:uncharacterized protein (DUF934 family)
MPQLLKDGQPIADPWTAIDDAAESLPDGPVLVSLERWRRDRPALLDRPGGLGVRLLSHHSADDLAEDLERFELIAVDFPKFRDGRGFSTARELRERYGYRGEIRAVGHALPDQAQFLIRTGFTTIELPDGANLAAWQTGLNEISVAYQITPGVEAPLGGLRLRPNHTGTDAT